LPSPARAERQPTCFRNFKLENLLVGRFSFCVDTLIGKSQNQACIRSAVSMTKVLSIFGSSSRPQLGPFEKEVLQKIWSQGSATVRELIADGNIRQAYTTVMTTMDRLYKKGLLDRVAEGRAFRYTARQTPEELQRVAALESIRQLLGSGDAASLPLSYLVEALSTHDAQLLDQLQLLVERKRRELNRDSKAREER
jgi:predicted transcriptional regulator